MVLLSTDSYLNGIWYAHACLDMYENIVLSIITTTKCFPWGWEPLSVMDLKMELVEEYVELWSIHTTEDFLSLLTQAYVIHNV